MKNYKTGTFTQKIRTNLNRNLGRDQLKKTEEGWGEKKKRVINKRKERD